MPRDAPEILKQFLNEKLSNFAWDLNELRATNVSLRYAFQLTDRTSVRFLLRRLSAEHSDIVRKEIKAVMAAWIINPATSPRGFPFSFAKKKGDNPEFGVNYWS